jgi:acyl-[acyl-carrier-protein]-phospholipid O-acyltransferase/long-chain-fatty-acid--[acyl-carrier-protein] ligase
MKYLLRVLLRLLFNTRLTGRERPRPEGPSIILPNHVSFLDAIFLYAYLPVDACYVVNTAIAAKLGFILKWVDHITVDPLNPYSLKKIIGVVKAGKTVVLFPEGRITTTGNLMKVYGGVGFIALKTGATLYPVIFIGPERSKLSRIKDKVKSRWFPDVLVYFGPPARVELSDGKSFRRQKAEVADRLLELLQNGLFDAKQQQAAANLFDELRYAAKLHGPAKTIAEDITGGLTYRQALVAGYVLGDKLGKLLAGQERAGVLLPNSNGHLVTLFALFYAGKTPAVMNFSAGVENNLDCGETAGIRTIITARAFVEKAGFEAYIARLAEKFRIIYLEDVKAQVTLADKLSGLLNYWRGKPAAKTAGEVILFTSGSESKPKGVLLGHDNILANINQAACVIDFTHRDKMLNALPMFHSFGLTAGTLLPVLKGIEVFLYPTPLHYKIIPEISYDRNVTLLLGTPTFLMGYAKYAHPYDFYSLRYVLAGGEKLKDEVRQAWQDKFGLRILEGYGTTETAPVLSINTALFNRTGTAGKFLPGIQWRVERVAGIAAGGNLLVKGPNVMKGYLLHGKGFVAAPEWYDCGDVVSVDEDGFVTIKSRLKRFAKVSGEMVSLDAVERVAEQCFATGLNAAVNLPDAKKGEKIILYTTAKSASKQVLREYMSKAGQSMLALPADVVIVDKLPLLGSGKTDYVTLRSAALAEVRGDD